MSEGCKNGHDPSEIVLVYKDASKKYFKKRCKACRRTGKPNSRDLNALARQHRIEDIEDLLRFGATFEEIVQRSGYKNWVQLSRAVREAGRSDVLERLRQRRGTEVTNSPTRRNSTRLHKGRPKVSARVAHRIPTLEDELFDINSRY